MSRFLRHRPRLFPGRIALPAAVAICFLAVAGCAAGQKTATEQIKTSADGNFANIKDIALRTVRLEYPNSGMYKAGENARLEFVAVNQGNNEDTLVSVSTDIANQVVFNQGQVTASGTPSPTATPTTSSPTATPTATPSATGSASPSASASGTPSPTAPTGPTVTQFAIPAQGTLTAMGTGPSVTFQGLTKDLLPSQPFSVTFTFAKAGTVTFTVPVAIPASGIPTPSQLPEKSSE